MKDYIYEENGKWHYDEWLEPESRGWVTHSFDTKEQAESYRDERENAGLAKMAGGEVERVDGLAGAIWYFENGGHEQEVPYAISWDVNMSAILHAARLQHKRQGE